MDKVQGQLCTGFKKEMWSDEATVTSEQGDFLFGISQFISPRFGKAQEIRVGRENAVGFRLCHHVMTLAAYVKRGTQLRTGKTNLRVCQPTHLPTSLSLPLPLQKELVLQELLKTVHVVK